MAGKTSSEANDYRYPVKASPVNKDFLRQFEFAPATRNKPVCRFDDNELRALANGKSVGELELTAL